MTSSPSLGLEESKNGRKDEQKKKVPVGVAEGKKERGEAKKKIL
jgi:hypothetical protein